MWSVVSSPLTLSFNLSDDAKMDRVWPIVTNQLVLRVNEAWAGSAGRRLGADSTHQVWAKPLGEGEHALFVVAVGASSVTVRVPLRELLGAADAARVFGEADSASAKQPPSQQQQQQQPPTGPRRRALLAYDLYASGRLLGDASGADVFVTDEIAPHDSRFYTLRVVDADAPPGSAAL